MTPDSPWAALRRFTGARVALGRSGAAGLPTRAHLAFQLAHAQARDAVHATLDVSDLRRGLEARGLTGIELHSAAHDRREYLLRPDYGRRLDDVSRAALVPQAAPCDIAFVLADGLSAMAINRHALPLLDALAPYLRPADWRFADVVSLVAQGRVAIGDDIAEGLGAAMVVVLIGERPGLSSPDSLGVYLTYRPRPGVTTDAERNCISNIHAAGLDYATAATRLAYVMTEARRRRLSGVPLKEEAHAGFLSDATESPSESG